MSKSKIFIGIAISFAVGILIASTFNIPGPTLDIFLGATAAGFGLAYFGEHKKSALLALFLFCAGLGVLRLGMSMSPNEYQGLLDNKQQLEGYITQDVDLRSNEQLITFTPKGFSQNILITAPLTQKFFYGDWVVVEGKPITPKNYGDFDYQKYLERFNVYAVMSYPKILILKSHQLNPLKEFLLKIKAAFIQRTNELLREPQSSLSIGILIGGHANMPQSIVDNFSKTGVSHIIAVSGFNITIIIYALASLGYLVGRRVSFWLATGTIVSFVIITGASASVLRAAIMGFLLLIALNIGRQYSMVPALFFAAFVMLIINPKILFWDVGFQLSFAATMGIIFFMPIFDFLSGGIPKMLGAKNVILTTLAAIIATLPLILFNFGVLSLSAPLVNVLILPVVPFTMLFGFLVALPFFGPGFAMVANWFLLYILNVIAFFAGLPYSYLNFQISSWIFWALEGGVFGIYFALKYFSAKKSARVEISSIVC
jgi:competence protein ComEC